MQYKKIITAFALSTFVLSSYPQMYKKTDWPEITKETKPWTRWWWLGSSVDKENLTYNLEAMSKAGLGGVEITPIYGVIGQEAKKIDYLSPRWMNMLSFTESEAARLGMAVDMNMGTGWPFGGPDVRIEDAATKSIFQKYTVKAGSKLNEAITVSDNKQKDIAKLARLMAYSAKGDCLDITDKVSADGALDWKAPSNKGNWNLIALFIGKTFQKVKRAAPGGQGYVLNHLDKDAVVHYFSKFDKAFKDNQTSFPHSFFNDSYEVYGADWSPTLLDEFYKRRGYKLENYFPELLNDGQTETSIRVISDYRETVGDMLKENFTKTWAQWAHERGTTTRNQAHGSPANLIDLYATVDIPECETFGITDFNIPLLRKDSIRKENDGDPTTLKYASSAAHIAGKKYTSAETFTWLTEHFRTSLSQFKPEIDQMFISGVNHVYFHGSTYSPKDAAWPGWKFYASVDMSPTNNIWNHAPAFFEYVTRCQSFLQNGQPDNDFLLYLPIYDIWSEQRGSNFLTFAIHGMRDRLPEFYDIVARIRSSGRDVDYISDYFLQSTVVENGMLKTEGGSVYKALILPAVRTIPVETFARVKELAKQGATIVFSEQYPSDVPGLKDLKKRRSQFNDILSGFPKITSFNETKSNKLGLGKIVTGSEYAILFDKCNVKQEEFKTKFDGEYIRRANNSGHHYFLAMLQNKSIDGWVSFAVKAESAMLFDPMTGKSGLAAVRNINGSTEVYLQLQPGESIILKTFEKEKVNAPEWTYYQTGSHNVSLTKNWELSFAQSEPTVKSTFKLDSLISWTDLPNDTLKVNMATGKYKTTFDFTKRNDSEYKLYLGDVRESAHVIVNGKPVATLFAVPFEMNIGQYLKNGSNTIEIEVCNLPANRIADYDKRGIKWRIFEEINFVSITYKPTLFDIWEPVPSGLLGPVSIQEIKKINP